MLNRREVLYLAVVTLLSVVSLDNALQAQEAAELRLALKGYDPVAYFTEGRPLLGKQEFEYSWDEARYRFASDKHLSMFRDNPDHYAPQFAGSCAMGMSKGVKVEANPENWLISDGRLFVFYPSNGPARFKADSSRIAAAGEKNWQLLEDAPFTEVGQ